MKNVRPRQRSRTNLQGKEPGTGVSEEKGISEDVDSLNKALKRDAAKTDCVP